MLIDYSIVTGYLENKNNFNKHWVFNSIVQGEKIYEDPDPSKREEVKGLLEDVKKVLGEFVPFNEKIYSQLYPQWREILGEVRILPIVGAPEPYDAMVRTHENREYIIFDLIRFGEYFKKGFDMNSFIRKMITHETSHLCLKKYHPMPKSQTYMDRLRYITFDEGFAHLLAFEEGITEGDYENIIEEHYNKALFNLKRALSETNIEKQHELLMKSNSGSYWDKFAAISGKLFLLNNLSNLIELFHGGVDRVLNEMVE